MNPHLPLALDEARVEIVSEHENAGEESKEKPRVPLPRYRPHDSLIMQDEHGREVWRWPPLELVQIEEDGAESKWPKGSYFEWIESELSAGRDPCIREDDPDEEQEGEDC